MARRSSTSRLSDGARIGARADESRRGFAALLLRGGRLTKLAGEVASFAPALGGAAVALLCAISVPVAGILGGVFLGLTAQKAMACSKLSQFVVPNHYNCGSRTSTLSLTDSRSSDIRISVTNSAVINVSSGLAFNLTHSGGGQINWYHDNFSGHREVTGATGVIHATQSSSGNIRILAKATLKTTGSNASAVVKASKTGSSGDVVINVRAVTASGNSGHGIEVKNDGSGKTEITASGPITSGSTSGDGITVSGNANNSTNASLNINVRAVTGAGMGMEIVHKKGGDVTITASGAVIGKGGSDEGISLINDDHNSDLKITVATVTAQGTNGGAHGIYVHQQHGGTVEINASGPVTTSGGHGIFVKQDGSDAVTINVTGSVTGDDDNNESAIKVEAGANDAVTFNLNSGAVVGSANEDAVVETGGSATVNVKSGAEVKGAIKLGGGSDKVILSGGTIGGSIDFGAGADTLEVTTSGTLSIPTLSGIEMLELGTDVDVSSAVAITGTGSNLGVTLATGTDVNVTTGTAFTLNQNGAGGIIFTQAASGQNLTGQQGLINATNSGAGDISITATGNLIVTESGRYAVRAKNQDAAGGSVTIAARDITSRGGGVLVTNSGSGQTSITAGHLNGSSGTSGSGLRTIISNSSTAASLSITVASVSGYNAAMQIEHQGGGNISITATGAVIGDIYGIRIDNSSGASAINMSVATVTSRGKAIQVNQRASGRVTINVTGTVNGPSAINVESKGTGTVTISASDTVTATNGDGIKIHGDQRTSGGVKIDVAAVTGGSAGIRVNHKRQGDVTITATGAVTGKGGSDHGIAVINEQLGSHIFVTAATVTAEGTGNTADGIHVDQRHSGGIRITASGPVTTAGRHGIYVKQQSNGDVTINVTGTVTGDDDDDESAIMVSAGSGDAVNVNLRNNATVGSANEDAIVETGGNTTVTVNSGATVNGAIKLGAGDDELVLAGGSVTGSVDLGAGKDTFTINTPGQVTLQVTSVEIRGFGPRAEVHSAVAVSGSGTDTGINVAGGTDVNVASGTAFTLTQSGDGAVEFVQIGLGSVIRAQTGAISATNAGDGNITIIASRAINVSGTGTGVYAKNSDAEGDSVTIEVGSVTVADGHGVHVVQDGSGTVDIDVGGAIAGAGTNRAAIRVEAGAGDEVSVTLESGAVVGAANRDAVVETGGTATLTVESGATLHGNVDLGGGGSDELVMNGLATLDKLQGVKTIKVGASGSATIKGTVNAGALEFTGAGGTLSVKDDAINTHSISGDLTGGGTIVLDIDVLNETGDKFTVGGDVTGTTTIHAVAINRGAPKRIEVFDITGEVASGSVFVPVGGARFTVERGTGNDIKKFFLATPNDCTETGSGEYTCSGTVPVAFEQSLSASGTTDLKVTLENVTTVDVDSGTAFSLMQTGGTGGITFTQSANGQSVSGTQSGIVASNSGGGEISINVNGSVTGTADDGISATNDASGGGITINAGSVFGADSGIKAVESGSGAVRIVATGSVAGTAEEGIYANTGTSGGAITVTAAAVTGSVAGIRAISSGTGAVSVEATGAVVASGTDGVGIDAATSGGALTITAASVAGATTGIKVAAAGAGNVSISASGAVTGTGSDGIFVDHDGSGATTVTVSSTVTGSADDSNAAIRTDVSAGGSVTVTLSNGASVGTGTNNAIMGGAGNTAVTVNTGATITGKVKLGGGTDTLRFVGGTFSSVTEMHGGAGTDTLTFSAGSGSLHSTVQSEGLKGWESIVVESGATVSGNIKLAGDSGNLTIDGANASDQRILDGGGGSANTLTLVNFNDNTKVAYSDIGTLTGWETFGIGDGTTVSFGTGTHTFEKGLIVASGGTLDVGDDEDTADHLTVSGAFTGGGRVTLDVRFVAGTSANTVSATSDSLTISGDVASGSTTAIVPSVNFGGQTINDTSPRAIDLVTVSGEVDQSAFTFEGSIGRDQDPYGYALVFDATGKKFYLKRLSNTRCKAGTGAGVFTCDGPTLAPIELPQTPSASGTTTLDVTLTARTKVQIDGQATAFTLTQSGGTGGIRFTQSANGQSISATVSGIVASNSGGGAISIDVNGSVTATSGYGIKAQDDASGGGITITAASVTGSASGIMADSSAGAVSIAATGEVKGMGASGRGIHARALAAGDVTLDVATVTGGAAGIRAEARGTGNVTVEAANSVTATGTDGIGIDTLAAGGNVTVSAAAVEGMATGIRAVASGAGSVSISASGDVVGSNASGIYASNSASGTGIVITAAAVTGSTFGIRAVSMGTGAVSISASGAVTGTGTNGIGIEASSSGGNVTVSAAGVTGTATGIKVAATGAGNVAIVASGSVQGTANDGIFVDLNGSGTATIAVSSAVTGGAGADNAAIRTDVPSGGSVIVTLNSGASVGEGTNNAIMGGAGSSTVTVNAGATVTGKVSLGGGTDTLTLNSGATIAGGVTLGSGTDMLTFAGGTFTSVTEMDGGDGSGDTLTFSAGTGSLHSTIQSQGLKGWESIVVESGATISGAIKLADDSGNLTLSGTSVSGLTLEGGGGSANTLALNGISGTLRNANLTGWETVRIGGGSLIDFGTGEHALESNLVVAEGGTLNLGTASGTDEDLTVSGDFAGGGNIVLDVSSGTTAADTLTINDDVSGTTTLDVRGIVMAEVVRSVTAGENNTRELELIKINGNVNANAFRLVDGLNGDDDPYRFALSYKESDNAFVLTRISTSECDNEGAGVFRCRGSADIEVPQSLSASGNVDLTVTLESQTAISIFERATAFTLTQTGGTGGISFTQSANGKAINSPLSGIVADNKAGGAILINVNGSVSGEGGDGIRALNDASGGGIAILAGSVTGSAAGIVAVEHGSGTVSVSAAGSVAAAAAGGIGISATAGRAAAGLSIAAGSVSGGDIGIRAVGSGGAISVSATGAVAGTGTAGVQVDGRVDVTDVAVSVATVTGATGVHVRGDGSGSVSVTATGAVSGTDSAGYGIRVVGGETISSVTVAAAGVESRRTGIRVTASGGADVSVSASGSVEGATHDGIYLDLDGGGETDVRVSGPVMGGGAPRTAALRTVSQTGGSAVRITLASGASVGRKGRRAIADTRGDATVTVNSGAAVAGEVRLGAGSDSLVFAGGAFSDVTVMDGGPGVDTLRFVRGSGTIDPSVSAAGFRGWESVIVESGAAISGSFTLAADSGDVAFRGADVGSLTALTTKAGSATLSFEGASGSIDGGSVSGWRSISISGGAKIGFGGDSATVSVKEELRLGAGATLEVGGNGSAAETLTISGTFAGGGTVTLDVDFANATSDKLVITGDATGRTNVLIGRVGPVPAPASLDDLSPIRNVITVRGTVGAGVAFGGFHELGAFGYQLRPSANGRNFDLIPTLANKCESSPGVPGAFTCSGTNTIGVTQTLSASGATSLSVTLNAEARVEAGGAAFVLEQTGGGGSLSLTQSATGMEIGGGTSGIIARNDGGGTISIDVNGSVTAAGGDGIRAAGGSGGSGVAVVAAAVSGSRSGIVAIGSGAGEVAVRASGTVTGTLETGIHARSDGRASVSVGAVSVSGGRTGIHAVAGAAAGGLTITAAAVSGGVTGIHAVASGTGAVSIMASGAVSGGSGDGILLERAAAGRAGISVSGPVGGGSGSGVAAIRTDAAGGSAISIAVNDGGAVGAAGRNAIIGGAGATQVTVNSGGSVAGSVDLGGGADSIVVGAGAGLSGEVTLGDGADEARLSLDANVSGLTRLDGGAGDGDTLRIAGGSGSLPEGGIGTGGLEGWESVVVESGASLSGRIRLAADSRNLTFDGARTRDVDFLTAGGANSVLAFNGVSDSLDANLEGWETVEIGGDSRVRFDAAQLRATAAKTLSVKGTLAFGDSRPGDAFTVDGDFAGGGSVAIDVNFAAGAGVGPTADRLVIGGDATGTTALAISDATPAGAAVAGGDMDIVTVRGEADAASFTLDSDPVAYGAYIYDLKYVAGTAGRDSRFVLSPGDRVSDAGAVLKSAPDAIAAGLARAAGLAARTAARMPAAAVGAGLGMPATSRERGAAAAGQRAVDMASAPARSLWARFVADSLKTDATGTDGESEFSGSRFQIGADLLSGESAGGMWVAGLTVQYGSVSSEAKGSGGTGRHEASGSGVGAAWTWFGTGGLYVDAQAQFGSFEADYTADTVGVIKKGVGGGTSLAAVEVGRRFAAGDGMMVVPSGRLGRSSVATDKFTSEDGIEIDLGTASTTEVRLGIAAEFAFESGGARLSGSVSRSLGDPDGVVIAGQTVERDVPDGWMELGFGGSYDIDEGKALFLDGAWRASLGDGAESAGTSLSGGFRINW